MIFNIDYISKDYNMFHINNTTRVTGCCLLKGGRFCELKYITDNLINTSAFRAQIHAVTHLSKSLLYEERKFTGKNTAISENKCLECEQQHR